ncbi:MAG TPA: class I SAM-dependent methyltransferase [Acidimicrobiia bacterium]|jgi:SAM-dependent methyltransferase
MPGSGQPIHRNRDVAESFGVDAERYDRTRPRYPEALVNRILSASPGVDLLDVGCGTGIAARQFQAAGCKVVGVEPDPRMADFARRSGVEVEVSRFEDWDAAGRSFDAVVAGTAWHWVDPRAGAVKAGRVLRTHGRLAPFHHVFQVPLVIAEAMGDAYRQVMPESAVDLGAMLTKPALDVYRPLFDTIADGIRNAAVFAEPEEWRFDWEHTYSRDEWIDQLPTFGGLSALNDHQLVEMRSATASAIDRFGGHVTVSYSTVVVTATRHSA